MNNALYIYLNKKGTSSVEYILQDNQIYLNTIKQINNLNKSPIVVETTASLNAYLAMQSQSISVILHSESAHLNASIIDHFSFEHQKYISHTIAVIPDSQLESEFTYLLSLIDSGEIAVNKLILPVIEILKTRFNSSDDIDPRIIALTQGYKRVVSGEAIVASFAPSPSRTDSYGRKII